MMQYFEWYLPNDGLWWKRCAAKAENLKELGITQVWLSPAFKGISQEDVGYAVYDLYDLGEFGMRTLFDGTLTKARPEKSVTFVDNHDTQAGQSLQSSVEQWFKPLAYAMILLREDGTPCVFYSDYYGNPPKNLPMVPNLGKLIRLRSCYAYGEQQDYLDHDNVIGWVRRGDGEHADSGMAVLLSDGPAGTKWMEMGKPFAGQQFYDALGNCPEPVEINADGFGEFRTEGGAVSVWVQKKAFEEITVYD